MVFGGNACDARGRKMPRKMSSQRKPYALEDVTVFSLMCVCFNMTCSAARTTDSLHPDKRWHSSSSLAILGLVISRQNYCSLN